MLDQLGYLNVTVVFNGADAIEVVMAAGPHDAFSAILMDCHMPTLDGLSATEQLREGPKHSHHRLDRKRVTSRPQGLP